MSLRLIARMWFCLLLLLPSSSLAAPSDAFAEPSPGLDNPLELLRASVQKRTLANGLRVILIHRPGAPVFVGQTWVKVGGVDEKKGITGIAHFFEHMAFKGNDKVGTKDYARERVLLDRLEALVTGAPNQGEALKSPEAQELYRELDALWNDNEFSQIYMRDGGVGLNAGTAKDYTFYTIALPKPSFELWCWMESERFLHPVFRQFYREREVVQEERRSGFDDDPAGKLYELLLDTAFTVHPYRLPNIGYPEDLRRVTVSDMKLFYRKFYRPDNSVLVLVGDLNGQEVFPMVEKYFGRIPRPSEPIPQITEIEPPQTAPRIAKLEWDAEPIFYLGFHKPNYPNPDDAYFAVLHDFLAGGRTSLFYRELVEKRRMALSVSTDEVPGDRFPQLFVVSGAPQKGVSNDQLRDEVMKLIQGVAEQGISPERLAATKRRVRKGFLEQFSSNGGLASLVGEAELLHNDWQEIFRIYELILSTTDEQVRALVRKYLRPELQTYVHLEKKVTTPPAAESVSSPLPPKKQW